jgi:outer membrane autotransporter protein
LAGTGSLIKTTTGTVTLSGNNTFLGATTINGGTLTNLGSITSSNIFNNATFTNQGSVGQSVTNNATGTFNNNGTVNGGLTNFGTTNANGGAINGGITNNGVFNVGGSVTTNSTFVNNANARLAVGGNSFTGITTLTNAGATTLAVGGNSFTGITTLTNAGATTLDGGTIGASIVNNSGIITATGTTSQINGAVNNSGIVSLQNNFAGDRLTINGNYVGTPGSSIKLDFQSSNGTTDQVVVNGKASGSTTVSVRNLPPPSALVSAPVPIISAPVPIITVTGGGASTFTCQLQSFGTILPTCISQGKGTSVSIVEVPTTVALSGPTIILPAAQTIGFVTAEAVSDRLTDLRTNDLRRNTEQGGPAQVAYSEDSGSTALAYAQEARAAAPVFKAPPAPPVVGPTVRPAVWARVLGDYENRDQQGSVTLGATPFTSDLGYQQRTGVIMGGADVVISHLTSANDGLIAGLLGGGIESHVDLKGSPTRDKFTGGTFGGYGTYLTGPWFADLIVKADFLDLNINNPAFVQTAHLTNYEVVSKIGYKIDMPDKFYVEPTGGLEWVRTVFDHPTALTATTVPLDNGEALRARVGARFGTEWITNNVRVEPSVAVFAYDDVHVSHAALSVGAAGIVLPTDQGKVRGEVQAAVNFFNLQTGLSGFVRGDTRFGEDLFAAGARAGVRYQW